MTKKALTVDLILFAMALWYAVSWLATGCDSAGLALMIGLLPYVLLYIGLRILFSIDLCGKKVEGVVPIALCMWGIAEAACGLWQVVGRGNSNHALFAMTGSFSNPGPYGGFIACIMSIAFGWIYSLLKENASKSVILKGYLALGLFAFCAGFLVLPASMSRAAWFGLAFAIGVTLLYDKCVRKWMLRHKFVIPIGIAVVVILSVGAFFLKRDSAIGRLHIWDIELRAIMNHPVFGSGPGLGAGAYGDVQADFFQKKLPLVSEARIRVAGCPEYPFNEFLGVGVETGLPGMLLAICLAVVAILRLLEKNSPIAAGLICWTVFSFASYPLSVPKLAILLTVFLAASASVPVFVVSEKMVASGAVAVVSGLTMCLMVKPMERLVISSELQQSVNFRRIYENGYSLFLGGEYAESLEILENGSRLSSDPMFYVIIGRDYEGLGDYVAAKDAYLRAHYMVPGRLYPLVRLMRLQIRSGQDAQALETAGIILDKPITPHHRTMQRLHDEVIASRDSLAYMIGLKNYYED